MKVDPRDLHEALGNYIEQCEEDGTEPDMKMIVQRSWPFACDVSGFVVTEDGQFCVGIGERQEYAKGQQTDAFDGCDY